MTQTKRPSSTCEIIALFNQKGGCGKTTTALGLAGALAARGERTLLVDLDPQAHATMALGCDPDGETSATDVLLGKRSAREALFEAPGDIVLLPASADLALFEEEAERTIEPEQALARALAPLTEDFDWILLDCPPRADGVICANALFASTTALLVVETGAFALQGALKAMRVLGEVSEHQGRSFEVRVVGTLFDRRLKFARELLIAVQARFGRAMYDTVIRTSVRLREAPALGVPVQVLDPACRATADFAALATEVVADAESRRRDASGRKDGGKSPARALQP